MKVEYNITEEVDNIVRVTGEGNYIFLWRNDIDFIKLDMDKLHSFQIKLPT
jgi:hypothetical protein